MPKGDIKKGGKSAEPAVPVSERKRDQAESTKETRAKYMIDSIGDLYDGHFMLTIKDNANNYLQADMLFLIKYCLKFCKSEYVRHEYEFGIQQRFHAHCIAKSKNGKLPFYEGLLKYLKKYSIFTESSEETIDGHIITRKQLLIDSLTFRLTPITSQQHLVNCFGYLVKEQCDFTDDLGSNPKRDEIIVQFCNY